MSHNPNRARMQAKGLQFDIPEGKLPVVMEDDIQHTVDFPICNEESCICHREEHNRYLEEARQQKRGCKSKTLLKKSYERGDLGENRGFSLFR